MKSRGPTMEGQMTLGAMLIGHNKKNNSLNMIRKEQMQPLQKTTHIIEEHFKVIS